MHQARHLVENGFCNFNMLRRNSRPRSESWLFAGGCARPSSVWHDEQDWALKVSPSPSLASVDAGAATQF